MPTNVFSVDLEDWYQGLEIDMDDWDRFTPRIRKGVDPLLDLLEEFNVKATFFILGYQAEKTPELIIEIANRGHEIASHGYSHRFVYRQSVEQFRVELRRSKDVLQDLTGRTVLGYRAPFFSITSESLWALDVLLEEGFVYDSSIFPVKNYRYGIEESNDIPYFHQTPAGNQIFEIPLSVVRTPNNASRFSQNVPISGGGYFRLYPYWLSNRLIKRLHRQSKQLVFYVHPWEYDPHHPRIRLPRKKAEVTHYLKLDSTLPKTRRLLTDFQFSTIEALFADRFLT